MRDVIFHTQWCAGLGMVAVQWPLFSCKLSGLALSLVLIIVQTLYWHKQHGLLSHTVSPIDCLAALSS